MAKKDEQTKLAKKVESLLKDVGDDRDTLREFLQELISNYTGEQAVGIAEYVAKIADSLTRQNQVKAAALKTLLKEEPDDSDDELDQLHETIGKPFDDDDELGDGSN